MGTFAERAAANDLTPRGWFAIGIYQPMHDENIGTLWRSALAFGASYIFTIGRRYKPQASDTYHTARHIPLLFFESLATFHEHLPADALLVCVELHEQGIPLPWFVHPMKGVYLLGSETNGLPRRVVEEATAVQVPHQDGMCLNVATAGSIVLYDRLAKGGKA